MIIKGTLGLLIKCVNISHSSWLLIKNMQVQNCFKDSSNTWPLKFLFESISKHKDTVPIQ